MNQEGQSADQPLVLAVSAHGSPEDLESLLNTTDPDSLRSATSIIFRVGNRLYERLRRPSSIEALISLANRVAPKPTFLVHYSKRNKAHALALVGSDGITETARPELIAAACQGDLLSVLHSAREFCYLRATKSHHFISPSGRHCSLFLRVGDAIRSVDALERLAFWLLPQIANADAVIIDSWTICSVVLRCLSLLNSRIAFDCLAAHPRFESSSAAAAIDRLVSPLPPNPKVACIVSVTSSGSFEDFIERIVLAVNRPLELKITNIYGFAGRPSKTSTVLCRLPEQVENYSAIGECKFCQDGSEAIQIDPRLYYFRDRKEIEKPLKPAHFSESRQSCLDLADLSGALRVHRGDNSGGSTKHHAFNIDVPTVLEKEQFRNQCVEVFRSLAPHPSVIVAPDHDAGKLIAAIAREVLRAQVVVHNTLRPTLGMAAQDRGMLEQAKSVLVVDDVLNSGKRLRDYNRSLREHFGHIESVAYFVVVARPESNDELKRTENALRVGHRWKSSFQYLQRLFLPRWGVDQCPWCQEYQFLSLVSERLSVPPKWLSERLSRLSEGDLGITGEPLFLLPGVSSRSLASQSKVAPSGTSCMAVLFAFAAALQEMRCDPDEEARLAQHAAYANVFALRNLTHNYDEALLQAILLRLVKRSEWSEQNRKTAQADFRRLASEPDRDILLGELLLALARDCVPRFGQKEFLELFTPRLVPHAGLFWETLNRF